MANRIGFIVAGFLIALMVAFSTVFIVDQRQVGVVYALGEIKNVITEPGLKFKLPPPFQNVVFLDKRIQTLDSPDTRPIFTAEKKSLLIDWMVKWRITDPRQFIRNNGADLRNLEVRLAPVVQAAFNEEVTRRTVSGVLATDRERVMAGVRERLADEAQSFGIEIIDVRVKRVDFVADITDAVYRRMESERKRVANELRSTGSAEAEKIRADVTQCDDLYPYGRGLPPEQLIREEIREAAVPAPFGPELALLDPGEISTRVTTGGALAVLMLCSRGNELPRSTTEDMVATRLKSTRAGAMAQAFLDELKANAKIEILR